VQAQRGREAASHAENAQIRQALDASRTAMMIADNDHVIRYVNRSVVALLRNQQATLRQAFPDFDAERLVGSSIHRFHANPDRIRAILNGLQVSAQRQGADRPGALRAGGHTGVRRAGRAPGLRRGMA
jgi:methyl-accepting chemotaxis protein